MVKRPPLFSKDSRINIFFLFPLFVRNRFSYPSTDDEGRVSLPIPFPGKRTENFILWNWRAGCLSGVKGLFLFPKRSSRAQAFFPPPPFSGETPPSFVRGEAPPLSPSAHLDASFCLCMAIRPPPPLRIQLFSPPLLPPPNHDRLSPKTATWNRKLPLSPSEEVPPFSTRSRPAPFFREAEPAVTSPAPIKNAPPSLSIQTPLHRGRPDPLSPPLPDEKRENFFPEFHNAVVAPSPYLVFVERDGIASLLFFFKKSGQSGSLFTPDAKSAAFLSFLPSSSFLFSRSVGFIFSGRRGDGVFPPGAASRAPRRFSFLFCLRHLFFSYQRAGPHVAPFSARRTRHFFFSRRFARTFFSWCLFFLAGMRRLFSELGLFGSFILSHFFGPLSLLFSKNQEACPLFLFSREASFITFPACRRAPFPYWKTKPSPPTTFSVLSFFFPTLPLLEGRTESLPLQRKFEFCRIMKFSSTPAPPSGGGREPPYKIFEEGGILPFFPMRSILSRGPPYLDLYLRGEGDDLCISGRIPRLRADHISGPSPIFTGNVLGGGPAVSFQMTIDPFPHHP